MKGRTMKDKRERERKAPRERVLLLLPINTFIQQVYSEAPPANIM
jgi:hypothetical protein